jgi:hypothetical protein
MHITYKQGQFPNFCSKSEVTSTRGACVIGFLIPGKIPGKNRDKFCLTPENFPVWEPGKTGNFFIVVKYTLAHNPD